MSVTQPEKQHGYKESAEMVVMETYHKSHRGPAIISEGRHVKFIFCQCVVISNKAHSGNTT